MTSKLRIGSNCRKSVTAAVALLICGSMFSTIGTASAQNAQPATTAPTTQSAENYGEPTVREAARPSRTVDLVVGQSRILETPWPVKRLAIADPTIADVDLASPSRVQLKAKSVGVTEVTLWSESGESWQATLDVRADLSRLQEQLRKLFGNGTLEATQVDDVVVIKGTLSQNEEVAQLRQLLKMTNMRYLDLTTVAGLQQVQLRVKVAEVSRTALRLLGINAFYGGEQWFGGLQLGSSSAPFVQMNAGVAGNAPLNSLTNSSRGFNLPFVTDKNGINVPPSATLFAGFPNSDLQIFIQALAENQYLRILAEPTLVARSGQEAHFLAGGEIPIPVSDFGTGTTQVSIEWKEFGVRLQFTPIVMGNGRIQLKVQPEVSELSDVGSIVIQGAKIPALLTRRVETTLDLNSGQTFAVAGLIHQTDGAITSRVPGMGDLPVIGALFRSVRYARNETEMLVLVTASLVEPSSSELSPLAPGDLHVVPNDWELYVKGRIQGRSDARISPVQKERMDRLGLKGLRGPGAWASYEESPDTLSGEGNAKD